MPTEAQHFAQAEKNERLRYLLSSSSSSGENFPDWEIVTLFYSALHYVDAVLATQGVHPNGHNDRNTRVTNLPDVGSIATNYVNLYHRSKNARYDLVRFPQAAVERIEEDLFNPVKAQMRTLLGLT